MPESHYESHLLLNRHQAAALAALAIILALTIIGRAAASAQAVPLGEADRAAARLDLNEATTAELQLVPGLGKALAERVLELRQQRGRFASVEELDDVRGIGPVRMQEMRPYIVVQ